MKKTKSIGLFIGRFQPFHEGHKKCIEHILAKGEECVVAIRDTEKSEKNPFTLVERIIMIREHFPYIIIKAIPNIDTVYFGRDVGYNVIQLDEKTENISATKIREKNNKKL